MIANCHLCNQEFGYVQEKPGFIPFKSELICQSCSTKLQDSRWKQINKFIRIDEVYGALWREEFLPDISYWADNPDLLAIVVEETETRPDIVIAIGPIENDIQVQIGEDWESGRKFKTIESFMDFMRSVKKEKQDEEK